MRTNVTSELISQIIESLTSRLEFNPDTHYVAVTTYDCGGTWQVWMDYGEAGYKPKSEVLINNVDVTEARTLNAAFKKVLQSVRDYNNSVTLR